MIRLFVSVLLVFTGIKSVSSDEQFSCKPIPGCQVSGCVPTRSSGGGQQREVLVTCQPGKPKSGLPPTDGSTESENLAQKVQDLERSRDELIDTVNRVENKSKKMEKDIADMKMLLRDLIQKNKDLVEERTFDRARISLVEFASRMRAGPLEPTSTAIPENGSMPVTSSEMYTWGEWKWSSCSASCGSGMRIITRACLNRLGDTVSTSRCAGGYRSGIGNGGRCNTGPCSSFRGSSFNNVDPQIPGEEGYSWGVWTRSSCNLDCGGGTAEFSRSCLDRDGRSSWSGRCPGGYSDSFIRSGHCNTQPCAVHYHFWGQWTSSSCSKTCGLGTLKRRRECLNYRHSPVVASPDLCLGSSSEDVKCMMDVCGSNGTTTASPRAGTTDATTQEISTVEADLFSWGEWKQSACTATCGGGTSSFSRICLNRLGHSSFSISSCAGGFNASYARSGPCNTQPCVVNLHTWSQWTESQCSTTCGLGKQRRRRVCWSSYYNRTTVPDHLCRGRSLNELSCMLVICSQETTAAYQTTGTFDKSQEISSTIATSMTPPSSTAALGGANIMNRIKNLFERAFNTIIFECNFDTVNDTCGLINDDRNKVDWIQSQNSSTANGGYLVVDTSRVASRQIIATIKTPRLQILRSACISFRFLLTNSTTATLKVKGRLYSEAGTETVTITEISASNPSITNSWIQRELPLVVDEDTNYVVVELAATLEVTPNLSNPTIALDDLVIKPRCQA